MMRIPFPPYLQNRPYGGQYPPDTDCRKATPNDGKLRQLFDGHGLMLAILPSGNKVWRMAYRNADGKQTAVIGP